MAAGVRRDDSRSTPATFRDCDVVTDRRGKEWKYSAPGDVWCLVDDRLLSSARSWQRLQSEFGPLSSGELDECRSAASVLGCAAGRA